MEKYRLKFVDAYTVDGLNYLTFVIQIKKWYGWITIKTIEGPKDEVYNKIDAIFDLLNK